MRVRNHRERKRNGIRLAHVPLSAELLDAMARAGFDPGGDLAAAVRVACEAGCRTALGAPAPTPPPASEIELVLATLPDLLDAERAWLREHPDALLDEAKAERLNAAYRAAEAHGLERGSAAYFAFFDQSLGYAPLAAAPEANALDTLAAPETQDATGLDGPDHSGGAVLMTLRVSR